jgi:cytochrome c
MPKHRIPICDFLASLPLFEVHDASCNEGPERSRGAFFKVANLKGSTMQCKFMFIAAATLALYGSAAYAQQVDSSAAEALAKKSGCLKCHSIAQKKDAPSYKAIAEKYKGKPDAEQKLYTHLTTSPKVKVDGKEEEHDSPKTKNEAEIRNLVRWVLSRP